MPVYQQNSDGTWGPAVPLDYAPGYDVEITKRSEWQLYRDGRHLVKTGVNRTRIGRMLAIWLAVRRDQTRRNLG